MDKSLKILLSIPSFLGIGFIALILTSKSRIWISENLMDFQTMGFLLIGLAIVQALILTVRVWSFERISRNKKAEETFYLFSLNYFAALHYIWKKDKKFTELGKNTRQDND